MTVRDTLYRQIDNTQYLNNISYYFNICILLFCMINK